MSLHRGYIFAVGLALATVAGAAPIATNAPSATVDRASMVSNRTNAVPAATAVESTNTTSSVSGTNSVSALQAIEQDAGFARFTNMVVHSLFVPAGGATTSGSGSSGATEGAIAANFRLTGFFVQHSVAQASVEDRNDVNKKYFLKVGDTIGDSEIKVVSFDMANRCVLLQKGDEKGRIEYENEAPAMNTVPGKPGTPGSPAVPGQPQVRTPVVTQGPPGAPTTRAAAGGGDDEAQRRMLRKRNRQQTVDRLKQMLQSTSDPATQQRLQNMITMLERAGQQDATEGK